MTWKSKTYHVGGGDNPGTSIRVYRYRFSDRWTNTFRFYKVKLNMPFENFKKAQGTNKIDYLQTLSEAPFFVKDHNVMDWAKECVTRGFASFEFEIDGSIEHIIHGDPELTLTAKFSDKGLASLFKLTFGGR